MHSRICAKPLLAVLLGAAGLLGSAQAQEVKYAIAAEVASMDPQFANLPGNMMVAKQMFEAISDVDGDGRLTPKLAETWKRVSANVWEFKLRKGVTFHDGSALTTEDVVYSYARPAIIPPGPATLNGFLTNIVKTEAVDALTVRITTDKPVAVLPNFLSAIPIVSKKISQNLKPEDFEAGNGVIGTGPYKFVKFLRADRVELVRNEAYWGKKPFFAKATIRFIPNPPARTAALLSGEVDAIAQVPPADMARLKQTANIEVITKPLGRYSFLVLNQASDVLPLASDAAGKPLTTNPFKDVRVRRAISKAIDRPAIASRVMEGMGVPTQNPIPSTMFGYNKDLPAEPYDLAGAKKLMAEAGYPNCFTFSLLARNDNHPTDSAHVQAIGQMLSRLGCKVNVEALPTSVTMSRANKLELPMFLQSSGADHGDVGVALEYVFSHPKNNPFRKVNMQTYDSERFFKPLYEALAATDDAKREDLYQETLKVMYEEVGVIPSQLMMGTWAVRKGLKLAGRFDERLYATDLSQ